MSTPVASPDSQSIRKRGLKMLAIGTLLFGMILYGVYWLSLRNYPFHFAIIPAAYPFALLCVGFIEAVTGAPYRRLADRWMALRGWQRGVIGTFIVLAALCVIFVMGTLIAMLLT